MGPQQHMGWLWVRRTISQRCCWDGSSVPECPSVTLAPLAGGRVAAAASCLPSSPPRLPLQSMSHEPLLCPEAVLEGQANQAGQGEDRGRGAAAETPGEGGSLGQGEGARDRPPQGGQSPCIGWVMMLEPLTVQTLIRFASQKTARLQAVLGFAVLRVSLCSALLSPVPLPSPPHGATATFSRGTAPVALSS